MTKSLTIVACPPYPKFQEAPEEHSRSELFDCPFCKSKMWLSDKKKGAILFASVLGHDIKMCCYDCLKKITEQDPSIRDKLEIMEI